MRVSISDMPDDTQLSAKQFFDMLTNEIVKVKCEIIDIEARLGIETSPDFKDFTIETDYSLERIEW